MKEESLIDDKYKLATQNFKNNNFQLAEKIYKEILQTKPNHLESLCYLGLLYIQSKKFNLAKTLFLKASEINPNNPSINNNLGSILFNLGDYQNAIKFYEKAINFQPNFEDAYFNLGIIFNLLGDYNKSFNSFTKVVKINPDNALAINSIVELLKTIQLSNITEKNSENIKNLFLFLLRRNNINHNDIFNNAKLLILLKENFEKVEKIVNSEVSLLNEPVIQNLLKEEIFFLILQKSLFRDKFLEKFLTKIRKEILFGLKNSNSLFLNEYINFIISLAEQSFLNEYLFFQSEKEIDIIKSLEKKILDSKDNNELEISILACYIPLFKSEGIKNKLLKYNSKNLLFNDMLEMQINEPLKEEELKSSIKSIGTISDEVSKKVKDQYEENPYPRWRYSSNSIASNFLLQLKNDIKPNNITFKNEFINPNILIAGCGTGAQLINIISYENANILAVDLSLSSLAYAKRKIEEIGYKKIEFLQGDILNLKKLNRKFDIIECMGVLHHMKEPMKGLKILLDLLKPNGVLKLGLYSEVSRKHIVKTREFIKTKEFTNNINDIRKCREIIKNHDDQLLQKISYNYDFYSISSTRDLIFHVQEHRFTIAKISKLLKDFNLEFLGFTDPYIKKKYLKFFPDDKKNISLENWDKFEKKNPDTFIGMYKFWVRTI